MIKLEFLLKIWYNDFYEDDSVLDILNSNRADYEYTIPLSQGKAAEKEGVGSFSINCAKTEFGTRKMLIISAPFFIVPTPDIQ